MPKYSTAFGMDVHLRSTTVCALDADTGEAVTRRFPGNPWGEIAGWMDGFPGPSLAVSVNIIFTISTNAFSPIAPTRIRRIRQRGCAAFGA